MGNTQGMFGTTGIRGNASKLFTDQFSFDVGRSFGIFLKKYNANLSVAIGSDPRDSSPRIKSQVSSGLIVEGLKVIDQGIAPIPAMNYILKSNPEFGGSIMISGSHIKAHLNGVKFFAFGEEILKSHESEIEKIYLSEKEKVKVENKESEIEYNPKAQDSYKKYLLSSKVVDYLRWRIVVDSGNGAQSGIMSQVLKDCGLDVIAVNDSNKLNFLARDTEVESDFASLKEQVVGQKADLGVGYDSDGDRAVFIDHLGSYIPGDYTGALIAKDSSTQTVVCPISVSLIIDKIGKKVIRTKVGSSYVVSAMKESGALFGFEANGGGIFNEMHSRDGGRTTIEVLNILARKNLKLHDAIAELPKTFVFKDKVDYRWEQKDLIIEKAKSTFPGIKTEELDGLKIWVDENTWILFRSSANAPEFRVFVESTDKEKGEKLFNDGLGLVKAVANGQNE